MKYSEEKVAEILGGLAKEFNYTRQVTDVTYRADYQDYQVIIDNTHHCEIREKLIDDCLKVKNSDALKDIRFRLEKAIPYEDGEHPDDAPPPPSSKSDMVVDNSADFDY